MAEMGIFSGFSQGGVGGAGVSSLSLDQGTTGGLGGQSGLQDLAGMLAQMLLGSSSDKSAGGADQSAGDQLLQSLQGNGDSKLGKDGQSTESGGGDSAKELLTQVLMALFEKILGGDGSQSAGGGQSGAGGTSGSSGLDALGGGKGVGGTDGTDGGSSAEDLVNSLMKSLGDGSLNQSISPTAEGGGQVSQDDKLKELLEMIGQFMDSHPETFGTPGAGSGGGGGGGGGGGESKGVTPGVSTGVPTSDGGGETLAALPQSSTPAGTTTGTTPILDNSGAAPVSFPTASSNPTVVNSTIKVGPGETFDGGGKTFTAGAALGDGGQGESQKPLFELAEGATLKNVVIGDNGADGVHVKAGSDAAVNVDNVHWTNVGEDALTVKDGGAKVTNLNITNSSAQGASDKIFQLNADANVNVDNFKAKDFGTFMRTNGGQQGDWNLNLSNISAENGKFSFVKSDSEGLNLSTKNIDLKNVENAYSKLPESTNFKEA